MDYLKASIFDKFLSIQSEILTDDEYELKIFSYLENLKFYKDYVKLKEFSLKLHELKKYECINTCEPVDLSGKIVVLDFWTYCCVNCQHILPLLNRIEKEYEKVAVLGVHSSKFSNEKIAKNIINAARKHLIRHPILLDFNLDIWNMFEIICWPSLLVVSPEGEIILLLEGEIQASHLERFIPVCLKYFEKSIGISEKHNFSLATPSNQSLILHKERFKTFNFPSKVCVDKDNRILFISDSGNYRILGLKIETRKIEFVIGSGRRGLLNGSFESAEFDWPQGLSYDSKNKLLYIADTFNDRVRVANLEKKQVYTVCGVTSNNKLGNYDLIGGKRATEQTIKTPWDVCLVENQQGNALLISCTGTHQIWLYSIGDSGKDKTEKFKWWNGLEIEWNTLIAIAGNGKERNKNNLYPLQASFAQPSGISLGSDQSCVYIADAESSSIRVLDLNKGNVKSVVGGDLEPDNLFSYGDVDGTGYFAKLQHPLDVAYVEKDFLVLVDTYNSSLKKVDLKTKICKKLVNSSGLELNEPSGICVDGKTIWICDSNNHSIKYIENFEESNDSYILNEFLILAEDKVDHVSQKLDKNNLEGNRTFDRIKVKFNFDVNENADNSCKIYALNKTEIKEENLVHLKKLPNENVFVLENFSFNLEELVEINFNFNLIICSQSDSGAKVCKMVKSSKKFTKKEILKIREKNKGTLMILIEK